MSDDINNIRKAIDQRFLDEWTATSILWPNVSEEPPANAAWISPHIIFSGADRFVMRGTAAAQKKGQRHLGFLEVQIFVPKGSGPTDATGYADDIRDLFNELSLAVATGDNMHFGVPEPHVVGASGDWWQLNMRVPFEHLSK